MKRRHWPWLVALAFVFGWASFSPPSFAQLLSPGPLSAPHASLEGDDKCNRCHTSGKGTSNALCTGCHANIADAVAKSRGLHGGPFRGQACAGCHSEHRGRGSPLIRFNPKSFDHGQTGFKLNGAHGKASCGSCHKSRSWMGLSRSCTSCHKDPHQDRFGSGCTNCHNESAWRQVNLDRFDHDRARFRLAGAHMRVACMNCHGSPAKYRGLDFSSCASCHHDPHAGRFSNRCTNCHSEADWHRIDMKPGAHPGVALSGGHSRVPCTKCHDKGTFNRPSRGGSCVSCHKAVHEAPFGKRCESCHAQIRWVGLPRNVGLRAHDKTPFALHGKHLETPCQECHEPEKPPQARYRELSFGRCADCHSDAHAGEFKKRDGGECRPCHTDEGFKPTLFGGELHATTKFPLIGHHVAVPCANCHDNPKQDGRRLDWRAAETACAKCHENPHGTQFAAEIKKRGCAGCHTSIGWDVPNIDHKTWPLTGAHASAKCGRCHAPTEADRKAGRGPSYRAAPQSCEGCHTDVHRGQFRLTEPARTCGDCHSTFRFTIGVVDHAKIGRYALDGAHRRLGCRSCHAVEKLPDGAKTTRWRLGYRQCKECHADPHAEAR